MLTCYDTPTSIAMRGTGLDLLLVGDSLGEVVHGFPNTTYVTIEMMELHTGSVSRGTPDIHIVADMPFKTYDDPKSAVFNAKKLIHSGADSVKLENPTSDVVRALKSEHIQVMGHVGLTPQTIHDYKKQGKSPDSAKKIIDEAVSLSESGCYAIVLEAIPDDLSAEITKMIPIPTIGIAAGRGVDGQVLVISDLMGLYAPDRTYMKKMFHWSDDIFSAAVHFVEKTKLK